MNSSCFTHDVGNDLARSVVPHTALAGRARIRSLLTGAGGVSLALLGGPLALPATLFGLVVVARRPRSALGAALAMVH